MTYYLIYMVIGIAFLIAERKLLKSIITGGPMEDLRVASPALYGLFTFIMAAILTMLWPVWIIRRLTSKKGCRYVENEEEEQ